MVHSHLLDLNPTGRPPCSLRTWRAVSQSSRQPYRSFRTYLARRNVTELIKQVRARVKQSLRVGLKGPSWILSLASLLGA